MRIHGGLAGIVGPGLIIGTQVAVRQLDRLATQAGDQPSASIIGEPSPPQIGGQPPNSRSAVSRRTANRSSGIFKFAKSRFATKSPSSVSQEAALMIRSSLSPT
jgi:hypothetical protein